MLPYKIWHLLRSIDAVLTSVKGYGVPLGSASVDYDILIDELTDAVEYWRNNHGP